MFGEADWDDDPVKTYKFKPFKKVTDASNSRTSNKESARKAKKKERKALMQNDDHEGSNKNIKKNIVKGKEKMSKQNNKKMKRISVEVLNEQAVEEVVSKPLLSKLRDNLKGGRFRYLNEQLYKTSGEGGVELFKGNSEDFEAYHVGYRHQVAQWPMNPLRKIIREIKKLPENFIIADFGCGDAMLAQSIPHKVYSIDLVSVRDDVIASDMANTPLKTGSIDVAVYCLSLMGVNLQDFLLEANRVLRLGGLVIIAEISSRFDSVPEFINNVTKCGFKLEQRELSHNVFVFFRFKKQQNIAKNDGNIKTFSLKPCLYKKR